MHLLTTTRNIINVILPPLFTMNHMVSSSTHHTTIFNLKIRIGYPKMKRLSLLPWILLKYGFWLSTLQLGFSSSPLFFYLVSTFNKKVFFLILTLYTLILLSAPPLIYYFYSISPISILFLFNSSPHHINSHITLLIIKTRPSIK